MKQLEISVVLSTYQRPRHLERSLASLAAQTGVDGQFEVVVTDDGSQDETPEVVARFAEQVGFPVRFVTHEHNGFQLARCRNSGVRIARASYLLFTDGDCVFPRNHIQRHLQARRTGVVRAGDCVLMGEETSRRIDLDAAASGQFTTVARRQARRRIQRLHRKAVTYQLFRHPKKPKLVGNNIGIWRSQLDRINGFDEKFRGWGCEDDDLAARLRRSGFAIRSVLGYTHGYHLWHPPHASTPARWCEGQNVEYLHRPVALSRCFSGLIERKLSDLTVAVDADDSNRRLAKKVARAFHGVHDRPEAALLLGPNCKKELQAECRIAVVSNHDYIRPSILRRVDAVIRLSAKERTPEAILARLESLLRTGSSAPLAVRSAA